MTGREASRRWWGSGRARRRWTRRRTRRWRMLTRRRRACRRSCRWSTWPWWMVRRLKWKEWRRKILSCSVSLRQSGDELEFKRKQSEIISYVQFQIISTRGKKWNSSGKWWMIPREFNWHEISKPYRKNKKKSRLDLMKRILENSWILCNVFYWSVVPWQSAVFSSSTIKAQWMYSQADSIWLLFEMQDVLLCYCNHIVVVFLNYTLRLIQSDCFSKCTVFCIFNHIVVYFYFKGCISVWLMI